MTTNRHKHTIFEKFAVKVTYFAGSANAFIVALVLIVLWAITGPFFDFSQTWQIIVNTGTTICTFLMVFLIQHSQNKDSLSTHLKLDELIGASKNASDRLINSEDLTEEELKVFKRYFERQETKFKKNENIDDSSTKSND